MARWQASVKEDPRAAGSGEFSFSGPEIDEQAGGVDFHHSAGLGRHDDLTGPARGGLARGVDDAPGPSGGGVISNGLVRRSRDAEQVVGAADNPAAGAAPAFAPVVGRGADPLIIARERAVVVRDIAAGAHHFPHAGGNVLGGMVMRLAALLAMQVGALTLITGELDAPWPDQLVALMIWLAGCAALFVSWR